MNDDGYDLVLATSSDDLLEDGEGPNNNNDTSFILDDDDMSNNDETFEMDHNGTISVDDAIERLGMGRFQLYILIAAGLCFASDAMQVMVLSFLGEVLKVEWDLTDDETAMI